MNKTFRLIATAIWTDIVCLDTTYKNIVCASIIISPIVFYYI